MTAESMHSKNIDLSGLQRPNPIHVSLRCPIVVNGIYHHHHPRGSMERIAAKGLDPIRHRAGCTTVAHGAAWPYSEALNSEPAK